MDQIISEGRLEDFFNYVDMNDDEGVDDLQLLLEAEARGLLTLPARAVLHCWQWACYPPCRHARCRL